MTYRLKFWTGPTLVEQIATRFREAGVTVTCEGTEHVYVNGDGSDGFAAEWNVLVDLQRKHGTSFGLMASERHGPE